jgi:signal transduction histidine kinase
LGVYTTICAIGVVFLSSLVTLHLTTSMEHATDVIIEWQLQYLSTLEDPGLRRLIGARVGDKSFHDEHYGLFTATGAYLSGDMVKPPTIPIGIGNAGWTVSDVKLRDGATSDAIRVLMRRRADGEVLYDGRDLDTITDIRHAFVVFLLYGGCLVLIASVIVGATYARRQIRRMHEIQAIVTHIANGALHLRLPDQGRDDIALLNTLVNTMLDDIERLMGEVKGACDGIAHDLRTPLAQVRLLLEEIDQLARAPVTAQSRRAQPLPNIEGPAQGAESAPILVAVEQAVAATDRLHLRFNAMLRISEINATRRRTGFADVDLIALVAQIDALYAPVAAEKGIRWRTVIPHSASAGTWHVLADEMLLFEVFGNLVDNAIKFTPDHGEVTLVLAVVQGQPTVTISDSGPGIPTAERQAVFSPFYRQRSHAATEGSGLGLSIVGAILKLHRFPYVLGDANAGHAMPGMRISICCHPT